MKALYALPDHEVVMELVPRIADTHLSADAAVERIRAVNGLVPVAIDPETETGGAGKVLWADIGDHLFREALAGRYVSIAHSRARLIDRLRRLLA